MAKLSRLVAKIANILKKENVVAIMEAMGNVETVKNAEFTKRDKVIKGIKKQTNKAGMKIKIMVCLIRWLYTGTAFGIVTFNAYLKTAKAVKSFVKENAESRTFFAPARILIKHVGNILFTFYGIYFFFFPFFPPFPFFFPPWPSSARKSSGETCCSQGFIAHLAYGRSFKA